MLWFPVLCNNLYIAGQLLACMLKQTIAGLIAQQANLPETEVLGLLEQPPEPKLGDWAFPCFILAARRKTTPIHLAKALAQKLKDPLIQKAEAKGPYVNIFLNPAAVAEQLLPVLLKDPAAYGKGLQTARIMVEYSQPNTHKEFHVGHLRTLFLGESIARLLTQQGNTVIRANYIGDVGAHVAKCLWCLTRFHAQEPAPANKGKYLGKIYTEAVHLVEDHPEYKDEVSQVQQALEAKEKDMQLLWLRTKEWSMQEFTAIYKETGVSFDVIYFESEVENEGKQIVQDLLQRGLAVKDQGAILVDLDPYKLGKFLLLKSDGTSLYSTKDLALAQKKFKDYQLSTAIYVVDSRQSLYFKQLFKTLELMGFKQHLQHVPYEFVSLPEGVISSRTGNIALYEDFRDKMLAKATQETQIRHPDWSPETIAATARGITFAALKFGFLKIDTNREIVFDLDEALSIQGETGPYVLYTIARARSILAKAGALPGLDQVALSSLGMPEKHLLTLLDQFPLVAEEAAAAYKPSHLARFALDLAQQFNEWYHQENVLKAKKDLQQARLALVQAVQAVLANALDLLGIEALDAM